MCVGTTTATNTSYYTVLIQIVGKKVERFPEGADNPTQWVSILVGRLAERKNTLYFLDGAPLLAGDGADLDRFARQTLVGNSPGDLPTIVF